MGASRRGESGCAFGFGGRSVAARTAGALARRPWWVGAEGGKWAEGEERGAARTGARTAGGP